MEVFNTEEILKKLSPEFSYNIRLRVGYKNVKSFTKPELQRECAFIIGWAFNYSTPNGQTSADIIAHQTMELFNCLVGRFGGLTILEVQEAFKKGLDNEYGQYYGMCAKSYNQFLKGFFEHPIRGKAWVAYLQEIDKPKTTEIPLHLKVEQSKQGCLRVFKEYKETGMLNYFPHKYYDMLNQFIGVEYKGFKTLVSDPDKRKEILDRVMSDYKKSLLSTKKIYERKGQLSDAESIMQKITEGFKGDTVLQNMQKTKLLTYYFDELIKTNKPLEI